MTWTSAGGAAPRADPIATEPANGDNETSPVRPAGALALLVSLALTRSHTVTSALLTVAIVVFEGVSRNRFAAFRPQAGRRLGRARRLLGRAGDCAAGVPEMPRRGTSRPGWPAGNMTDVMGHS